MHNLLPPTTTVPVTEQDTVVIVDPVTFDTTARQPSLDPTRYRRPSLGRVVHALVGPKSSAGADVAPAVIVQMTADSDMVNLRAFTDSGGLPAWMVGLTVWQKRTKPARVPRVAGRTRSGQPWPDRPRPLCGR